MSAAIEVASARGWDAATTRQIAERAGVNQALIHYHFRSKEQLLHVAFEAAMRDMFEGPTHALVDAPTLGEGIALLVAMFGRLDAADPAALFASEALARASRDAELRSSMASLLAELRALVAARVERDQARGDLDPVLDPVGVATALAALFDGLGLHMLVDPTLELERTAAALSRLFAPPSVRANPPEVPS